MRKVNNSIDNVKDLIQNLQGKSLKISVNKGRKRIVRYVGSILETYPQVFVLKIDNDKFLDKLSCSYSDVICGDIKLGVKE
ncbi:MAG: Veg family protein [Firmicutes bacterium]|nr:Veg family protein [Bacillota bacterium]